MQWDMPNCHLGKVGATKKRDCSYRSAPQNQDSGSDGTGLEKSLGKSKFLTLAHGDSLPCPLVLSSLSLLLLGLLLGCFSGLWAK